jgi:hypothetical protein
MSLKLGDLNVKVFKWGGGRMVEVAARRFFCILSWIDGGVSIQGFTVCIIT